MVNTVSQAFEKFRQDLEPLQSEKQAIIKRHTYIRETFSNKIENDGRKHSFLSGSYSRNTLIRPISDVDIVILFDIDEYWGEFKNNPTEMLKLTKEKISETYSDKKIKIQSHSIGIEFSNPPDVDIIPGFIKDYEKDIYFIPDINLREFIMTSPTKHKEIITSHNKLIGGKFIHIIKMFKCWRNKLKDECWSKYGMELKLKSFHLEVFLMNILGTNFSNYAKEFYQVFSKAVKLIDQPCYDPAGLSGRLDKYLTLTQKMKFKEIFIQTSVEIQRLLNLEMQGNNEQAIEGWRGIFGTPFPLPEYSNKSKYNKKLSTEFPPEGKNYTYGEK